MPGNALLRRLGLDRTNVIARATQAADSGFWLAVRVAPDVTIDRLRSFLDVWVSSDLAPITDVVLPHGSQPITEFADQGFTWCEEVESLADISDRSLLVPAPAKGAERLCRELHLPVVVLDESVPEGFVDPCFASRAEREKSFVRCAKALFAGVTEGRSDRVVLWTRTDKVIGACRSAAHVADLAERYEFCVPETEERLAERLITEGQTVRVWFALDRSSIERAVGG